MDILDIEEQAIKNGQIQANKLLRKRRGDHKGFKETVSSGVIIAEGDSWFDYPGKDILDELEDRYLFDVEKVSDAGDKIEDMAYLNGQLEDFIRKISKVSRSGRVPKAILLSGGGNDITGDIFTNFLNHADSPNRGLNEKIVHEYVDVRIKVAYVHIISAVDAVCEDTFGSKIPIITHGYDFPVPDGKGCLWYGPWLEPGFRAKNYNNMDERKRIIASLIDRFNKMMKLLSKTPGRKHVSHIDLRGTLPNDKSYKRWWDNELHPTKKGFERIGKIFADRITSL